MYFTQTLKTDPRDTLEQYGTEDAKTFSTTLRLNIYAMPPEDVLSYLQKPLGYRKGLIDGITSVNRKQYFGTLAGHLVNTDDRLLIQAFEKLSSTGINSVIQTFNLTSILESDPLNLIGVIKDNLDAGQIKNLIGKSKNLHLIRSSDERLAKLGNLLSSVPEERREECLAGKHITLQEVKTAMKNVGTSLDI